MVSYDLNCGRFISGETFGEIFILKDSGVINLFFKIIYLDN